MKGYINISTVFYYFLIIKKIFHLFAQSLLTQLPLAMQTRKILFLELGCHVALLHVSDVRAKNS
jgi:hypothetical protein